MKSKPAASASSICCSSMARLLGQLRHAQPPVQQGAEHHRLQRGLPVARGEHLGVDRAAADLAQHRQLLVDGGVVALHGAGGDIEVGSRPPWRACASPLLSRAVTYRWPPMPSNMAFRLPVSRRRAFKALSKPARAGSRSPRSSSDARCENTGVGGFVQVVQQRGGGVQPAAQDQVLGQGHAQRHDGAARRHVLLGVGAHRPARWPARAARGSTSTASTSSRTRAVDALDQFGLEGARADVDQRMQVGRLVAAQAGGQQRRDRLRAFAGQQRHAQQGHALAVAAQHRRALPVDAQRHALSGRPRAAD